MMIDFHTHLDHYQGNKLQAAVECIKKNKIKTITSSCSIKSYLQNIEIAKQASDLILPTFGIHPSYIEKKFYKMAQTEILNAIEKYLLQSRIIGEVGMDFYWEKETPRNTQEKIFCTIMEHCNQYKKIAVIHTKGAEKEIQSLLKKFPYAKPVIHWYDGPEDIYKKFIDSGFYFTFGCEILYSKHIQELLKITPMELILSETDNPSGEPWLGGTDDSPLLIKRIIKDIADVKKLPVEDVEAIIENNTLKLAGNEFNAYFSSTSDRTST
jgi:TatD DNase family protein